MTFPGSHMSGRTGTAWLSWSTPPTGSLGVPENTAQTPGKVTVSHVYSSSSCEQSGDAVGSPFGGWPFGGPGGSPAARGPVSAPGLGPPGGEEGGLRFEYPSQAPRDDPAKPRRTLDDMESPAAPEGADRVTVRGTDRPAAPGTLRRPAAPTPHACPLLSFPKPQDLCLGKGLQDRRQGLWW